MPLLSHATLVSLPLPRELVRIVLACIQDVTDALSALSIDRGLVARQTSLIGTFKRLR